MSTPAEFPALILAARRRLKLTQAECATLLSISTRTLSGWENGTGALPSEIERLGAMSVLVSRRTFGKAKGAKL